MALDGNVEADCQPDFSDSLSDSEDLNAKFDANLVFRKQHKTMNTKAGGLRHMQHMSNDLGFVPRETRHIDFPSEKADYVHRTPSYHSDSVLKETTQAGQSDEFGSPSSKAVFATRDIDDAMIEDGSHVVFDWDNTLKLYNKDTRQLSSRVSREFLMHLKHDRGCKLYIISAIRPSAMNLATILFELDKLGLTDVFVNVQSNRGCGHAIDMTDQADGPPADQPVVKPGEYARQGSVIICGYDKAETFLKLSSFDFSKGQRVMFFDDEFVNIDNFSAIVPNSVCYLVE